MKTMKVLLRIGGYVMIVAGVACLVAGYMEQIRGWIPKKKAKAEEFVDYADVDCE